MKITYLWIDGYKNLKNLEIYLEENSPVNALIGNNGSGKSNILEAVVKIFVSLKDGSKTEFDYEMHFSDNEEEYTISCKNHKYRLSNKNGSVTLKKSSILLPSVIFLYYAGETNRLNELVEKYVDKQFDKALKLNGEISLKYISFINVKDFAPAFLANYVFETDVCQKVCELVGVDELSTTVRFILKRPSWSKTAPITSDSFWNAKGTVATVLHQIKDLGELNIIDKNSAEIEISNIRGLKNIAVDTFELLVKFKLLVQAGIIDEIDFKVLKDDIEMPLDFLSEGEKQISQLLLFLEATKDYKTLFLLDEIDSYLHPSWQRIFAEMIDDLNIRGQVVFTTHSPLTLGKMRHQNIRILSKGEIFEPSVATFNRDISEVLEEIMDVGLRPIEIQNTIDDFKSAALFNKKEQAKIHYETLTSCLDEEDPFWSTVKVLLERLGD